MIQIQGQFTTSIQGYSNENDELVVEYILDERALHEIRVLLKCDRDELFSNAVQVPSRLFQEVGSLINQNLQSDLDYYVGSYIDNPLP